MRPLNPRRSRAQRAQPEEIPLSILVLGADGYLGWPLVCRLAATLPGEAIIAVDDLSKRRRVTELGYASGIPLLSFEERITRLRQLTGRSDIAGLEAGVTDAAEELIRALRPRAVVHLAQIPSAPYSMRSFAAARETLENNEVGNLAVLWAIRDHSPSTHLVKMGSMGEYAPCGVPVGEGYVEAVLDGERADRPVPFPRAADDVYHITKINDSTFVAMACRVWGLAATDVMQSVVYGVRTQFGPRHPELATRFDCDPVWGSVLNRFVAQAILGIPLTLYAGGTASTGLIALQDTLAALAYWIEHPAERGEHRVINQAIETRLSIRQVAEHVARVAAERGLEVQFREDLDPRHEAERRCHGGAPRNVRLRESGIPTTRLDDGIRAMLDDVSPHVDALATAGVLPQVDWIRGEDRVADPTASQDTCNGEAVAGAPERTAIG